MKAIAFMAVVLVLVLVVMPTVANTVAQSVAQAYQGRAEIERARGDRALTEAAAASIRADTRQAARAFDLLVLLALAGLGVGAGGVALAFAMLRQARAMTQQQPAILLPPTHYQARAIETGKAYPALIRADLVQRDAYGREIRRV
jgi:hypothetical protein